MDDCDAQDRAIEDPECRHGRGALLTRPRTLESALTSRDAADENKECTVVAVHGNHGTKVFQEEPMELELLDEDTDDEVHDETTEIYLAGDDTDDGDALVVDLSTTNRETRSGDEFNVTNAENDELLMRLALQLASFEPKLNVRSMAWSIVAQAFVTAGGVGVQDGAGVATRISIVTFMLYERPYLLTPALRTMVLEFSERNCRACYAMWLSGAFLQTLRVHASASSSNTVAPPSRPTIMDEDDTLRMRAEKDARLLRLALKHRPCEGSNHIEIKRTWVQISNAFNATVADASTRGGLLVEKSALMRISHMTTALLDPTLPYHTYLTPTLRAMLIEFHMLNSTTVRPVVIDTVHDEQFLQIVLARRPFDASGRAAGKAWKDIHDAFMATCDERTRLAYGGAKNHMVVLTTWLRENPYRLMPAVRAMVSQYHNLQSQAAAKNRTDNYLFGMAGIRPWRAEPPSTLGADQAFGKSVFEEAHTRADTPSHHPTSRCVGSVQRAPGVGARPDDATIHTRHPSNADDRELDVDYPSRRGIAAQETNATNQKNDAFRSDESGESGNDARARAYVRNRVRGSA